MLSNLGRPRRVHAIRLLRHSSVAARSGIGGSVALFLVIAVSYLVVGSDAAGLLVASMGASAVLLFSAPEAPLSQPWNLLGGHTLSAVVGVTCAQLVPSLWLASALSVGLAIAIMAFFSCTHPPGGATSLSAVMGGSAVHELGFQYVLVPVLLNSLVIFAVALLFHLPGRSYPRRIRPT